jgi:uncharacterized phage protein (TIGR01671 family)
MNREIKFEYGFQSVNGILKKVYHLHEIPNIKEKCDLWNELPIAYVRQFTGLHDKNGQEIYEGDMLNIGAIIFDFIKSKNGDNVNYEVKFDGCDYILFRNDFNLHWGRLSRLDELCWNCQVVGNIFENPELLQP